MIRRIVRIALLACALVVFPQQVQAQSKVQESKQAVDLTYAFLTKSTTSSVGADFTYWRQFRTTETYSMRWLAEMGFTKFDGFTLTTFQGGARWVFAMKDQPKFRPFVHVLAGIEHCCGANGFSIQPGGGLFIAYNDSFDIIARVDFRHVNYDGGSDTHQRYSVGVTIPVGKR